MGKQRFCGRCDWGTCKGCEELWGVRWEIEISESTMVMVAAKEGSRNTQFLYSSLEEQQML